MARSTSNVQLYYSMMSNSIKRLHDHLISPPMYNQIFKNKQGLLYKADIIPFKKTIWNQNPMLFCIEQYKDQHLFPIILICNDIGTIYDFTSANLSMGIKSPLIDNINKIISVKPTTDERY